MKNLCTTPFGNVKDNSYPSFLPSFLPYLLTTILFLTMNSIAWGQCAALGSGTCTAATDVPSGIVTWSGYYCVGSDITISGNLTISSGSVLEFNGFYTITVTSTGSLSIDNTDIYGKAAMWDEIKVEGGGSLILTNSRMQDGTRTVYAENGASESLLYINGNVFCNNETGIYIDSYSGNLSAQIINNDFYAPLLKKSPAQMGDYGIFVNNVNSTGGTALTIGTGTPFSFSTSNNFYLLGVGIRTHRSDVNISNNTFDDIKLSTHMPTGENIFSGKAIVGTSTGSDISTLEIGSSASSTANNIFTNCIIGIFARNNVNVNINYNVIDGPDAYTMETGIDVENSTGQQLISRNIISDFSAYGIYVHNQINSSMRVTFNTVYYNTEPLSGEAPFGIVIDDLAPFGDAILSVVSNTITKMKTGIFVRSYDEPLVESNVINFIQPEVAGKGYGIRMESCTKATIQENSCVGACGISSCTGDLVPYYFEDCTETFVNKNYAQYGDYYNYLFTGNVQGSNLNCNESHNSLRGIGLYALVGGGMEPPPIGIIEFGTGYIRKTISDKPADNSWYSDTYQVYTFGSTDATDVIWYYQTSPSVYNITSTFEDASAIEPDFQSETSLADCYSPYRITGDSMEEINTSYESWAESYLTDAGSTLLGNYYRAWMFWKEVNAIAADELIFSTIELSEAFSLVAASNIPILQHLFILLNDGSYEEAAVINNAIVSDNVMEENLQEVIAIYLNSIDEDADVILSDADETALWDIAHLPARENGIGVYMAQTILKIILDPEDEEEEKISSSLIENNIALYPNPSNGYLKLSGVADYIIPAQITITDLSGNMIESFSNKYLTTPIDVSELSNGLYIITIMQGGQLLLQDKFLILKNN